MSDGPQRRSRGPAATRDGPRPASPPHTVIYGAGATTRLALQRLDPELRASVRAIVDDDGRRRGELQGLEVKRPGDYALDQVERVIIASEMHGHRLRCRAREIFPAGAEIVYAFDAERSLPARLNRLRELLAERWTEPQAENALWYSADGLLTSLRERLAGTPTWRYGPQRQLAEFGELRALLDGHLDLAGRSVLNFGCGPYHPLGLSIIALIGGASTSTATDLEPMLDAGRSARATVDLIAEMVVRPLVLGLGPRDRCAVLRRIESFIDVQRLAGGDLVGALRPEGLSYEVESVYESSLPESAFDLVVGRDVFEHLPDVPAALEVLYRQLRSGGFLVLAIDLSDHRRYEDPRRFQHWSHLVDTEEPTHLDTNRLRYPDYPPLFARAGFEVVRYQAQAIEPLPPGVRATLAPMYRMMSEGDLAVSRSTAVLRKPG